MNKTLLRSSWLAGGLLLPGLAAAVPLTLISGAEGKSANAANLRPGVVAGPSGAAIYAMNPDGGIDAISSASGELLWSTREAARPLAIHRQQLIAQRPPAGHADALDLVFLDLEDGARRQTFSIELPEGVRAAVDQGMSTTFDARAVVLEDQPYAGWDHTRRYAKGVAPEPGANLEHRLAGASRLDLIAGRAVAVEPAILERPATLPAAVQQAVQQRLSSGELGTPPAPAGEVFAATLVAGERIILKRWNLSGEPLPDVDLFSGPYLLELRSADGRHLLVAERVAPGEWQEYGWSVFSLESGRRLGQVQNHQPHAWYVIHDATLIYVALPHGRRVGGESMVEPLTLRAVLLDGGAVVWERPLRDTSYRGPFPP